MKLVSVGDVVSTSIVLAVEIFVAGTAELV